MIVLPATTVTAFDVSALRAFPTWTGNCDSCGLRIKLDEPYLFWMLIGKWLSLHTGCATDLIGRLLADIRNYQESKEAK